MNPVKHVFDSQRHHFTKGGRFEKYYFLFENIESVFFAPAAVTSTGPHVRDSLDVKRFMFLVIAALLPHYAFGIFNVGYQSNLASGLPLDFWAMVWVGLKAVVPMVVVTYAVGYFWEALLRRCASTRSARTFRYLRFVPADAAADPAFVAGGPRHLLRDRHRQGDLRRYRSQFLNPALTGRAFSTSRTRRRPRARPSGPCSRPPHGCGGCLQRRHPAGRRPGHRVGKRGAGRADAGYSLAELSSASIRTPSGLPAPFCASSARFS